MRISTDKWHEEKNPEFWKDAAGTIAIASGFMMGINAIVQISNGDWVTGLINSVAGIVLGGVAITFILYQKEKDSEKIASWGKSKEVEVNGKKQ
jgi:hypothetical protein